MKMKTLALLFAALLSAVHLLHADILVAENITVGGTIEVETDVKTAKPAVLPLTIANVLYLLGVSGTASDMRYYFDTTEHGYVIAPKADETSGVGTPAAILLTVAESGTIGTDYVYWQPNTASNVNALSVTGFGGVLTGTAVINSVYPRAITTTATRFIIFGVTPNGGQTTVYGNIIDAFPTH
jgi:hypothetical protein